MYTAQRCAFFFPRPAGNQATRLTPTRRYFRSPSQLYFPILKTEILFSFFFFFPTRSIKKSPRAYPSKSPGLSPSFFGAHGDNLRIYNYPSCAAREEAHVHYKPLWNSLFSFLFFPQFTFSFGGTREAVFLSPSFSFSSTRSAHIEARPGHEGLLPFPKLTPLQTQ